MGEKEREGRIGRCVRGRERGRGREKDERNERERRDSEEIEMRKKRIDEARKREIF